MNDLRRMWSCGVEAYPRKQRLPLAAVRDSMQLELVHPLSGFHAAIQAQESAARYKVSWSMSMRYHWVAAWPVRMPVSLSQVRLSPICQRIGGARKHVCDRHYTRPFMVLIM